MIRIPVLVLTLLLFISGLPAAQAAPPDIIKKIESRRGLWTSLKAGVKMEFQSAGGKKAVCRAELAYSRLAERILLKAWNAEEKLLFVFKTEDTEFELYLPHSKAVYSGSIFDLEDSPELHSHLKALDLYRALKPMLLSPSKKIERGLAGKDLHRLRITGNRGLEREVYADENGEILREIYFKNGKAATIVERSDFRNIKRPKDSFTFPWRIMIRNPGQAQGNFLKTVLTFESADFAPFKNDSGFFYDFPEDARQIDLSEEFRTASSRQL